MTVQVSPSKLKMDLADHFLECTKLGRYLTVFDGSRFVITDDFGKGRKIQSVATAMAAICSKDTLVAQAAIVPLARMADQVGGQSKGRFEELFDLIEREATSPEVKENANLMLQSGFRLARIKSLEAELGGKITPARKRYFQFLVIVRQVTEGKVSAPTFRDEFLEFTRAVAGRLDFGIYSFCLDRIFANGLIPLAIKRLIVDELLKYPPLIRRELLTNILVTNAKQAELGAYVRSAVEAGLTPQAATEIRLLEQVKQSQLSLRQIEKLLVRN
ncbi:hypothetical protein JCM17960_34660 [Magnetospira thiophila]